MSTAVVWFRRDLRLHDHPPLVAALREHDEVVPLFVLDDRLVHGRFPSANRTQYLLECLQALDDEPRRRGSCVRHGKFEDEIPKVVVETGADGRLRRRRRHPVRPGTRQARRRSTSTCASAPATSSPASATSGRRAGRRSRSTRRSAAPGAEQPRREVLRAPADVRAERVRSDGIPSLE